MESGNIVEFIDRQKIICAVVLEVKKQRLRLLTENNREVTLSAGRLSYQNNQRLDLSLGRDKTVEALKVIANRRESLSAGVPIKELWEVLNSEKVWIDLGTMTAFCFPDKPTTDHESAVVRAFFKDRLYFKFSYDRFYPNTEEAVERKVAQQLQAEQRERLIQDGAEWLGRVLQDNAAALAERRPEIEEILKACYLFDKDSQHYVIAKSILNKVGIDSADGLFQTLVRLGAFDQNENVDLYRLGIPTGFSEAASRQASALSAAHRPPREDTWRRDLTHLPIMTIDGQATLDFDDAISIIDRGDHFELGIHIVDVGHYIKKEDAIDREALLRGSSIYMPDGKIPMIPPGLAEDLCSLKAGQVRPAISVRVDLGSNYDIVDYEIFPSLIQVKDQLTYYDVNLRAEQDPDIILLRQIAEKFRQFRIDAGAIQIALPDVNVWIDEKGEVQVNKVNRESPGRMLVAELMIMANWLMATFLDQNQMAAIYRSQPAPKERLYKGMNGTLFQNVMQRKLLSRFVLTPVSEHHSGLGLNAYVTATSPIRKYFDLVTQRQVRAVLGLEPPSTREEIDRVIQQLEQPMSDVFKIQAGRNRYWLLKHLEKKIGQKEEAIVLLKRRQGYQVLLTEYMLECDLPLPSGIELKPEDMIQVTLQHVNARKDVLTIFMG